MGMSIKLYNFVGGRICFDLKGLNANLNQCTILTVSLFILSYDTRKVNLQQNVDEIGYSGCLYHKIETIALV